MESTPISSPACMVSCAPSYCAALRRTLPNNCLWQVRAPGDVLPLQATSPGELHLYEEIIARSATKASLSDGNFLGMMNVLIQLRKVCDHPDLFKPALPLHAAALVTRALERHPLETLTSKVLRFWDFNTDTSARMLMQELVPTQAQFIDIDDIVLPTPATASASLFSSNSGVAAASLCGAKFEAVVEQHYALLHNQKLHKMTSNCNLLCTLCCRSRLTLHWRSVRICQQLPGPLFTTRVVQAKQDARANRSITPAWLGLVRSVAERAEQMHNTIRQFAFVPPPPPCGLCWTTASSCRLAVVGSAST